MRRSLNPHSSSEEESLRAPRSTHASSTGKLAQMLGPRNDRTLRNSISLFPSELSGARTEMLLRELLFGIHHAKVSVQRLHPTRIQARSDKVTYLRKPRRPSY